MSADRPVHNCEHPNGVVLREHRGCGLTICVCRECAHTWNEIREANLVGSVPLEMRGADQAAPHP